MRYQDFGDDDSDTGGDNLNVAPADYSDQSLTPDVVTISQEPSRVPSGSSSGSGFVSSSPSSPGIPSGTSSSKASIFNGKNTPLILGAVALGLLGLVMFSSRSTKATPNRRRRHKRSRR